MAKVVKIRENELTMKEAADYCGIALGTLYNKIAAGEGPQRTRRFGKTYVNREDLDAWLRKSGKVIAAGRR